MYIKIRLLYCGVARGVDTMEYQYEKVVTDEKIPLRIIAHEEVNGNRHVNKHWHQSLELIYCTKGMITCFKNSNRYDVKEEDLLLINSNEIHSLYSSLQDKGIILQLPLEFFLSFYQEHQNLYFDLKETSVNQAALLEIKACMMEMMRLKKERMTGYDLRIHSLLYEMEYILVSHFYCEKGKADIVIKTQKYLDRLSEITQYLQQHYKEDIRQEDVAEQFSLAPQYLSRFFKKYANISFSEYVSSVRLDHAYKDLMNTDNSILKIAMDNGFANPRSFSDSFRNVYGVTPSKFKRRMAK